MHDFPVSHLKSPVCPGLERVRRVGCASRCNANVFRKHSPPSQPLASRRSSVKHRCLFCKGEEACPRPQGEDLRPNPGLLASLPTVICIGPLRTAGLGGLERGIKLRDFSQSSFFNKHPCENSRGQIPQRGVYQPC